MEWSGSGAIGEVGVDSAREEKGDRLDVATLGRPGERGTALVVGGVDFWGVVERGEFGAEAGAMKAKHDLVDFREAELFETCAVGEDGFEFE